jgi:HD-GYP domain-containing protein (c-di-GMP phosphodiesterase class II)
MKSIKLEELIVGGVYSKPIYLDKDTIFINANTAVSQSDIDKLKKFGMKEVFCAGEMIQKEAPKILDSKPQRRTEHYNELQRIYNQIVKSSTEFKRVYKELFDFVQSLYRKASEDKIVEINEIRTYAELSVDFVKANPHFYYYLLNYKEDGYYLYNQSVKSTLYSLMIANSLDYSKPRMMEFAISAMLADIGMAKIPSSISEKNGTLNEDEYKIIKKHPLVGYQIIIKNFKIKNTFGNIALMHHENFDGTGYPQKLKKQEIDEPSAIYSIADNFCSMISDRPWRRKFLPYDALKTMISITMNKFDPKILRVFLNKISMYPIGSYVELSDGSIGKIMVSNENQMLRPSIVLEKDSNGKGLPKTHYINLVHDTQIYIIKAVDFIPQDEDY